DLTQSSARSPSRTTTCASPDRLGGQRERGTPMTAGYSGTPQARKLGLKAGQRVALDEPPAGWQLREPPDGLLVPGADGAADLIIPFFRAEIGLPARLP